MEFKEFRENVIKWARERLIIPNSSYKAQYIKLIEELGELALGIRKKDEKLIKDSIGDVAVVLCVLAGLEKVDKQIALEYNKELSDSNFQGLVSKIGFLAFGNNFTDLGQMLFIENIRDSIYYLNKLSEELGYSFNECLEIAWNEIKDRKGYLREDGIFIKEADYKKVSYDNDIDNSFKYPTNIENKE